MIHWLKRLASSVPNAAVGKVRLFADTDNLYKTKDDLGVVRVLGDGITTIQLVNTTGLQKTYRITRQSGATFDFVVTDARSIVDIQAPANPGQPGATDTYQIVFNDGPNDTFIVYNGTNGLNGQGQPAQNNPTSIDPDDAASIGTRTAFYALEDHQHAIVAATAVGLAGNSTNTEGTATSFARSDHTHAISNGGTPSTITPDAAANQGASTSLARSDHTHAIAADVPVALGAAAAEGTSSSFARADHVHLNPVIAHEAAADPHPQYTTAAEAAAAAPVQSFNGRTGSITPQQADYDAFFTTPAEASAAAPVQSVAGKTGAVTLTNADVGLGNVRNPVVLDVRSTAPQTLNQTLTAAASVTIPANSLVAGDAFEIDVLFGTLVNTTAASNLEVAVFINGTQNAIAVAAMGTTAVAAPGRGGRALFKVVFRSVGAAGTALANGTIHVNALANFASNQVAVQTVNTTANVTLDVRVRTSAATTTGTVQIAAIEQCT